MAAAPADGLHLPMPRGARLRRVAERIIADPSRRGAVRSWAREAGLGEPALARLAALRWMGEGASVKETAARLGYESAGGFAAMFGKVMGTSPGRYLRSPAGREQDRTAAARRRPVLSARTRLPIQPAQQPLQLALPAAGLGAGP